MKCQTKIFMVLFSILFITGTVHSDEIEVLATNSWTAAFASAAGVEEPGQLAPADMNHPPEYELKPSDVRKVRDADFLIYAGYEVLMKTILESFNKTENELIRIQTSYHPAVLRASVLAIARRAGNMETAEQFLSGYDLLIESSITTLKDMGLHGASILVHFHQKPLAEALGFNILGVFGPAPVKAGDLVEYRSLDPEYIFDNGHNPIASPISEVTGGEVIELYNFPGGEDPEGRIISDSLSGVLEYNMSRILSLKK